MKKKHNNYYYFLSIASLLTILLSGCSSSEDIEKQKQKAVIEELPVPGFEISQVIGNTVSYNSVAEFYVRLITVPTADVTVPLSSSDVNEGEVKQESLLFTSENWFQFQQVTVYGRNENIENDEQDYFVVLSPVQSDDELYNEIDPDDVPMKGIVLELGQPVNLYHFVAGQTSEFSVQTHYTGRQLLAYELIESPDGMSIDTSNGVFSWAPEESTNNQIFNVKIKVTDGVRIAENSFTPNPYIEPSKDPIQA